MGFWSELSQLGKDIGAEAKQCGFEIKGITADAVDEFKADPSRYTLDSVKEIGAVTGKVAVVVGKVALEVGKHALEQHKEAREQAVALSDEELLKSAGRSNLAALDELKTRGYESSDIAFIVKSDKKIL